MNVRSVNSEVVRIRESVWEESFECHPRSSVKYSRISMLLVIQVGVSYLAVLDFLLFN
jgi:hypothetical protein